MVTGLRGVGKTVLLTTFSDIAESKGFRTAHHEITEAADFPVTIARMSRKLLSSLSSAERMKAHAVAALRILKAFSLRIPNGPEIGLDVEAITGIADTGTLAEDLPELFLALGQAAEEANSGVMFFLDEIHYVPRMDLEALLAAVHRVGQENLPVAVVGAGLPQLPGIAGQAKSYAERLFDFPWIGSLSVDHAVEAISRPARDLEVEFEDAALIRIVQLSAGYPYFLQEYGKHVWNLAENSPISMADVNRCEQAVQSQLDENFFRVRIWRTTPAERRYLLSMAELGDGPYRSSEIADALGMKMQSVAPTRANLIHKGLIFSPEYGLSNFSVPKFADFMRRTYSE